jgi:hypothetical protein
MSETKLPAHLDWTQQPDRWVGPRFKNRRAPLTEECLAALRDEAHRRGRGLKAAESEILIKKFQ